MPQGIAGSIDRFGQALGPVLGGYLLGALGQVWLLRATGLGLAAVTSVCMLHIGEGCMSWVRPMLSLSAGYAPVRQQPLSPIEEEVPSFDGAENGHVDCHAHGPSNGADR